MLIGRPQTCRCRGGTLSSETFEVFKKSTYAYPCGRMVVGSTTTLTSEGGGNSMLSNQPRIWRSMMSGNPVLGRPSMRYLEKTSCGCVGSTTSDWLAWSLPLGDTGAGRTGSTLTAVLPPPGLLSRSTLPAFALAAAFPAGDIGVSLLLLLLLGGDSLLPPLLPAASLLPPRFPDACLEPRDFRSTEGDAGTDGVAELGLKLSPVAETLRPMSGKKRVTVHLSLQC
mmetsp:Transcript_48803/g.116018  ORF Transcript_48803/g.116018 Transcript_48803/m.116018 type:complete len:226 (-) Transcript_48803:2356-3033(-)